MDISFIIDILDQYKLYEFIFLAPLLLFAFFAGIRGFFRGIRKQRFKTILGLSLVLLSLIFLGPITNFVLSFNIRPILEALEPTLQANNVSLYDPNVFTGSISLKGILMVNIEKYAELELGALSTEQIIHIVSIVGRIVVFIVLLFIVIPVVGFIISVFRWLFFRDGIKKRKINEEN